MFLKMVLGTVVAISNLCEFCPCSGLATRADSTTKGKIEHCRR